ncbi:hypothetical protein [Azospirillum agricola]|uniref:hypothetical protein n=1 Tax=Azospirillum agricola TaxID=1720247 RepID=UPI000A0F04E8|nr:hypothetical protein [Azospirillum agricola]SMH62544.1 Mu-like prophage FluMu protein gp28 [Azospirillum lipoferum]
MKPRPAAEDFGRLPAEIPSLGHNGGPPMDLLLAYQKHLLETTALFPVVVVEKSRRIGYTWAIAADAVLTSAAGKAAKGMDTLYIGYNLDMAREFIDTCGAWARLFDKACSAMSEELFDDGSDDGIKAFRISFASGFEIVALASRPRSLRGRQGYVIIDEAAFHDDLDELLKAAMALLIWGGKVAVISTHNGTAHPFNQLIDACRAGKKPYPVLRVTFDDALKDGLFRRICLVKGDDWSQEAEDAWAAGIYASYGDAADEELRVIPKNKGGTWLPRDLVVARMSAEIPVLRWECEPGFVDLPDYARTAVALAWCEEHLKPLLDRLDPTRQSVYGHDYARLRDASVGWPAQIMSDLTLRTAFVFELRNVPDEEQKLIVRYVLDRMPRLVKAAIDAGGNGASLAERMRQLFGPDRVEEVKFSTEWYRVNMPPFKAALEGAAMLLAKDADILVDFGQFEMRDGVAQLKRHQARTTGTDGYKRHGDAGIAAVLAHYASRLPAQSYGYEPARSAEANRRHDMPDFTDDDDRGQGFGAGGY